MSCRRLSSSVAGWAWYDGFLGFCVEISRFGGVGVLRHYPDSRDFFFREKKKIRRSELAIRSNSLALFYIGVV